MTDMPGIVVTGASGRMGQMLIRTVPKADACASGRRAGARGP